MTGLARNPGYCKPDRGPHGPTTSKAEETSVYPRASQSLIWIH